MIFPRGVDYPEEVVLGGVRAPLAGLVKGCGVYRRPALYRIYATFDGNPTVLGTRLLGVAMTRTGVRWAVLREQRRLARVMAPFEERPAKTVRPPTLPRRHRRGRPSARV